MPCARAFHNQPHHNKGIEEIPVGGFFYAYKILDNTIPTFSRVMLPKEVGHFLTKNALLRLNKMLY